MRSRLVYICIAILLACSLSACGQKGPLVPPSATLKLKAIVVAD